MWFSNNNNNNNNSKNQQTISAEGQSTMPNRSTTSSTTESSSYSTLACQSSETSNKPLQESQNQNQTTNQQQVAAPTCTSLNVLKEDRPEKISFHLKTSIFTRRVTIDIDKMALGLIKQLAIAFLNELYFQHQLPTNTYIGDYIRKHFSNIDNLNSLYDRIILRKYDCEQDSFVPFYSVSDIQPDAYISIEVGERQHLLNATASSCSSSVNNHQAPLQGSTLISHQQHSNLQQYLQPQQAHPNQSFVFANSSSLSLLAAGISHSSTTTSTATSPNLAPISSSSSASSSSAVIAAATNQQVKMAHEFKQESFLLPTYCASCSTLIKGVFRQGFQCTFCKKNFCPKCKNKAEAAGDSCLVPNTSQLTANSPSATSMLAQHQQQQQHTNQSDSSSGVSSMTGDSGNVSVNGPGSSSTTPNKLDVLHLNMSKRKSASNLLHFNIGNPFKSHHAPQQQQQQPQQQQQQQQQTVLGSPKEEKSWKGMRGSAGALDPVLQQLGKQREQQRQQNQQLEQVASKLNKLVTTDTSGKGNLLNAQSAHLSSSHQNLYLNNDGSTSDFTSRTIQDDTGKLTAQLATPTCQVGANSATLIGATSSGSGSNKLSSSARSSVHDLHANSPTKRDSANHTFVSMDWIQINGEPICDVCNKALKQSHQQVSPFICKSCKLQVHAHCQNWVLTDCMSRIVESSRAAAERRDSNQNNDDSQSESKTGVKSSNSNVSRDNIRLHRLAPSVKNIKRPDATKPIMEGWLKHTTLSDELARRHYWRLDGTDITLYENDTSKRYFKAIPLSTITRVMSSSVLPKRVREDVLTSVENKLFAREVEQEKVDEAKSENESASKDRIAQPKSANNSPAKSPQLREQMNSIFAFEQASGSMYLVQANSEHEAARWRQSLADITAKKLQESSEIVAAGAKERAVSSEDKEQVAPLPASDKTMTLAAETQTDKVEALVDDSGNATAEQLKTVPTAETGTETGTETVAMNKETDKKVAPDKAHHHHHHHHQPQLHPQPQQQQHRQPPVQQHRQHHHHYSNFGHRHHRSQHRTFTDPNRSRLYNRPRITIKLDPMSIPDHIIEGKYLIERDRVKGVGFEELGSGQFGKVYAAISEWKSEDTSKGLWSGVPVAIKEISKARFDLRQQAKLKNEANILSRLDHQGVIILERVHDLPDKIYIVMEQLEDDMLEMIVSTEEKRLNERITKFLTYQILEALKYLHAQNIAHCDLKPENVLLVERRSQFPQIKLCDFGFAKIIEENSFRSSLVGTPAYLAPEVVKGERYNRSVDLWSVGVIVYVSLSGEFPFNEGENIHDQISRATFMWPDQTWAKISRQAREFIESLLLVNCEKRLSAYKAQQNAWLQDYQLWCDLSELELRVGTRWLTDDTDFKRWSEYAKRRNLQLPRSAIQLHEEQMAEMEPDRETD